MTPVSPPGLRDLILGYLDEGRMMQLAMCVTDQPWCCNVWYAYSDDLTVYWFSSINRRHSDEVSINHKVAGAIVVPQTPEDVPRGLQFQGVAERLTAASDRDVARSRYVGRIFPDEKVADLMASPTSPHAFYRIRPTRFVLFDARHFPDDPRQEYRLATGAAT